MKDGKPPPKIVNVRRMRDHLSDYLKDSQIHEIVIVRHGKPIALLKGVQGHDLGSILADLLVTA